jgi:tetratricopeptide (TPR) repeat protein
MVEYFPTQGLNAPIIHGGTPETIKAFVASGIPVIVQQWLYEEGDPIGHYRVVRGYDDNLGVFRVNDSMTGADVHYSYAAFERLWRAFSYRYLPIYRPDQEETVRAILEAELDPATNRARTAEQFAALVDAHSNDAYYWFSYGTNLYETGRLDEAIAAYERAEQIGLPSKMLWYQFWPVIAYNDAGNHDRALDLATAQLATAGIFGDMRYERGRAYEARGQIDIAIAEYRRALVEDANLDEAREALHRLGAN